MFVMGVSFGAMVGQHLALRHPELVKRLVLCCGPSGGEGGMAYPIHAGSFHRHSWDAKEWYTGLTIEERVLKRMRQANRTRDEAWKTRRHLILILAFFIYVM